MNTLDENQHFSNKMTRQLISRAIRP